MLRKEAADILRHARWAKRLTIREVAEQAGVSLNLITKIENGGQPSQGQKVYAIADVLEVDAASLFQEAAEAS